MFKEKEGEARARKRIDMLTECFKFRPSVLKLQFVELFERSCDRKGGGNYSEISVNLAYVKFVLESFGLLSLHSKEHVLENELRNHVRAAASAFCFISQRHTPT